MADGTEVVARNKKAKFEYDIEEALEAGLVLEGSEVKSVRQEKASLDGAYCQVDREGEMKIHGMYIKPYEEAGRFGHEPRRTRKLLLHDQQIRKWGQMAEQEGYTIVPLSLYFRDGWAKLKIGIAKGRQKHDKRQVIKEREMERRLEQEQSDYNF
ncbi:SsrA-binding protein SmpB [Salinibacter altiplanensis]|uniref:SsrA-binding protein SmpB n=1 Tax=Salinibacter altiplanensis TaxID=1803181 RepID=UPI000C9F4DE9|nr:SsrA-binding protein SmpB [Salinibacter altiplanensis]